MDYRRRRWPNTLNSLMSSLPHMPVTPKLKCVPPPQHSHQVPHPALEPFHFNDSFFFSNLWPFKPSCLSLHTSPAQLTSNRICIFLIPFCHGRQLAPHSWKLICSVRCKCHPLSGALLQWTDSTLNLSSPPSSLPVPSCRHFRQLPPSLWATPSDAWL